MIDLTNFDWGWMDEPSFVTVTTPGLGSMSLGNYHKEGMIKEIFTDNCYEKFYQIKEGDIVVDIGASVGPFTYSILHKKPKHVFCLEPSEREFKTLVKNTIGYPVTQINKGISYKNSIVESDMLFGGESEMEALTFKKFINLFGLEKIDFIKTDCEGGEYDIFTEKNLDYLINNVSYIAGEWHLQTIEEKEKFRNFRDNQLILFKSFEVFSVDGIDIKWDLWNEHFIEYYNQIHLYIDNSKLFL
jgi:FkbM family methyltransferase